MNSTRSFLKRARTLAQLGLLTVVTMSAVIACGNDTPLEDDSGSGAGKTGSSTGTAGKSGKAGSAGSSEDAGAAGAGEAGEGGAPSAGGMQSIGGRAGTGGATGSSGMGGGSAVAGGAQGGNGGAPAVCGNNKLEAGEECDDGNTNNWDGCNSVCKNKCEQCEMQNCAPGREDTFLSCFTQLGSFSDPALGMNLAAQGPAQGQPKDKLCTAMVECLRRTNCAQEGNATGSIIKGCFCGSASPADCNDPQKGAKGPCAAEIGAAAESLSLTDVSKRENSISYTVGIAKRIAMSCDADVCPAECYGDRSMSACERCTIGDMPFAKFHGIGGEYFHCYFQPPIECASSTGQATSMCPATTCAPAADCALATHCAVNAVTDCYGPTGQGPCAAQFAAATGSTDPATVLDRLTNGGDYASAALVSLLADERQDSCQATCFPGSGAGAGGSGGTSAGGGGGASGSPSGGTGG